MNGKLLLLLVILVAFACNNAENDTTHNAREAAAGAPKSVDDSLYEEVDKLHIEGMSKMGPLRRSLAQIQQRLDSMVKLPTAKLDGGYQQALIDLQEDLNYANYSMDQWMTEFKDTIKGNPELRIKYLQSEKEKVTKVRDNILNGLQRADSLLKK